MNPRSKQLAIIGGAASAGILLIVLGFQGEVISKEYNCNDGIDNDGDGLIDELDDDCDIIPPPPEDEICNDGIDNDGDGLIDMSDPDCIAPPPDCDHWYHWDGVACVPDSPSYGMTLTDLGLAANWQGAYYDGGKWRVLIDNPFFLETSPPAPKNVHYLVRWVGPDGVIYEDDRASFCGCGGTSDNLHMDRDDELAVGGIYIPTGNWQVHIFGTTVVEDIGDPVGKTFEFIGSDNFTVTPDQASIFSRAFCFISPSC